jgi:hypothetical protein
MKTRRGGLSWKKTAAAIAALMGITAAQQPQSTEVRSIKKQEALKSIGLKIEGKSRSDSLTNSYIFDIKNPKQVIDLLKENNITYTEHENFLMCEEDGVPYAMINLSNKRFVLTLLSHDDELNTNIVAIFMLVGTLAYVFNIKLKQIQHSPAQLDEIAQQNIDFMNYMDNSPDKFRRNLSRTRSWRR